jgi:hypothetical protein
MFSFRPEQTDEIVKSLTEVTAAELSGRRIRPAGTPWWPKLLEGQLEAKPLGESGLAFYKHDDRGRVFLALDRQKGRGFFWSGAG